MKQPRAFDVGQVMAFVLLRPQLVVLLLCSLFLAGIVSCSDNTKASSRSHTGTQPAAIEREDLTASRRKFSDAVTQLCSGNIENVERRFSGLQSDFEKGKVTEYELFDAYKAFYQQEDRYRPQFDSWIKAYPSSASAYLARGTYYRKLGDFRRGTQYVPEVPNEDLNYMEQMHALATRDLETSVRLNPKSYLAILQLLNIAQFDGDEAAARRYLNVGNEILPSNFMVRARYLITLTPKWGGSYEQMDKFIAECKSQGVPQGKLDLFNAIKFDDQGRVAEEDRNHDDARGLYEKALGLSVAGGPRFRRDYLKQAIRLCRESGYSDRPYCN
jgi:tetratricopeptide (TPR) repeat protein